MHLSIFFDVFVFLQVFNFFNARKLGKDEVNICSNITDNYLFMLIVVGIFLAQLFIVQFGGKALMLVPLSASQHFVCICIGALSLVNGYVVKKCIPEGCFSCVPMLNETEIINAYDVDSELKKIWFQPATHRRSSKHRI
jgi:magnesium-transporting ATPase (P-type)